MKAIVIGAGIGGLTTAVALKQLGIAVRIYEQSEQLRAVGAGLSLWANAIHALDKIGLGDTVRGLGLMDETGTAIRNKQGETLSAVPPNLLVERYGALTAVVHRAEFLRALVDAAGDVITYGKTFNEYKQIDGAITAHFTDGSFDTGNVLIGADGIHSVMRGQMHPRSQPVYSGYAVWRGVTQFSAQAAQYHWGESWGVGLRFGLLPLSDGRVYWFAVENRPQNTPPPNHKAYLTTTFAGWHMPIPAVIEATPTDAILYNDVSDLKPLRTWIDGRAVLMGDAAHAMTPNMGQGACQAIEDAVVLARLLSRVHDVKAALTAFQRERLSHTRRVQSQSRQIGQVAQLDNAVLVAARDAGMRLTPSVVTLTALDWMIGNRV